MLKAWEEFEQRAHTYLKQTFGTYATFTLNGASDSTIADILVEPKRGASFHMEAKLTPAQSGQFVLLPDTQTNTFQYSPGNKTAINPLSTKIIQHMNMNFTTFSNSGTKGQAIVFEDAESVFISWVVHFYHSKGVRYIITNDFKIFPINDLGKHFHVTATYRIKKSGSSSVGTTKSTAIKNLLPTLNIGVTNIETTENKVFVSANTNLDKKIFSYQETRYMFAKRNDRYEVRKLSNTNNANVIFSITSRQGVAGLSKEAFMEALSQY